MRKPIICIAPPPAVEPMFFNDGWMVNKKYFMAVTAAGGVPVLATDIEMVDEYAKVCDGLILTGSAMFIPSPEHGPQGKVLEKQRRDPQDRELFYAFQRAGKPIFGICRGMQLINVFYGGDMVQDLGPELNVFHKSIELDQVHAIRTADGSIVRELYGEVFTSNSYHHQSVGRIGAGLRATAWVEAGFPEAIEHESLPIFAVQFHPERMTGELLRPDAVDGGKLFRRFLELCAAQKG